MISYMISCRARFQMNEMFTFEMDSENASILYTGTLKTPGPQRSNFRRLKFQLKLTWWPFAIGAPRAGPPTQYYESVNSLNLVLLENV
jgi:hypothetical protein